MLSAIPYFHPILMNSVAASQIINFGMYHHYRVQSMSELVPRPAEFFKSQTNIL